MSVESIDLETLAYLVRNLVHAKTSEENAKHHRIDVEEKIARMIPGPDRGQKTVTIPDGRKVTVERGFNYKADCEAISTLPLGEIPAPIKTKTTREIDATGYEWFKDNHPELFSLIAQHVVATPKKVSITIKDKK